MMKSALGNGDKAGFLTRRFDAYLAPVGGDHIKTVLIGNMRQSAADQQRALKLSKPSNEMTNFCRFYPKLFNLKLHKR